MSAIVGLHYLDGRQAHVNELQPLMNATAFYGGDDSGVWSEGAIALGYHMLHFTPESLNEHMPLTWNNLTIVADARIDNRVDLFPTLNIPPEDRVGMPDSLLILHAYRKWATDTAVHLIGDFAIAIWDSANRHLYCTRDYTGTRPFFYYQSREFFAFSNDLESLLALPNVEVDPDEESVLYGLKSRNSSLSHPTATFYRNIKKLGYAHSLVVSKSGIKTWQYWQPPVGERLEYASEEDYFEQARELVKEAVNARMRTNFGIGAHLSGGLDSSSVAIIAARLLRERGRSLEVYSWSPPEKSCSCVPFTVSRWYRRMPG